MMVSLYNGVSGIKTQSFGIDVTSNNIANVNTVGFVGSTPEFKSIFYQSLPTAGLAPVNSQVGLGATKMASSLNTYKQGSFQTTDGVFDMAIQGDGFFGVQGLDSKTYFTRNGDFVKDKNGDLVDKNGFYLQGAQIPLSGATFSQSAMQKLNVKDSAALTLDLKSRPKLTQGATSKIHLPDNLFLPTEPTTEINFKGVLTSESKYEYVSAPLNNIKQTLDTTKKTLNLSGNLKDSPSVLSYKAGDEIEFEISDASGKKIKAKAYAQADGSFGLENLDVKDLDLSGNLSVSGIAKVKQEVPQTASFVTDMYAANNNKNTLKIDFTKIIPSGTQNSWKAVASVYSPNKTLISQIDGMLSFNERGALINNTLNAVDNGGSSVKLNFGSIYDGTPNSGLDGVVMSGEESGVTNITRDGYAEGVLKSYAMNDAGEIVASFDNGKATPIAKVALYHFQNDQGLSAVGDNLFEQSANSGAPIFYTDANGNVIYGSKIAANTLEMSNVELGNELVNLIVMQKAYDASAKSITTSNEILQTIIGLKR